MKKPTIICVDDEKFFLTSIKNEISRIFENKINIEIAESGEEALDLIYELIKDNTEIPIIISDYMMPGMHGDELLIKSHKMLPISKKVLLTGQATLEGIENVVNNSDLYRYIIKPWDSTDLKLTISEAFRAYYRDKVIESQNKSFNEFKLNIDKKINDKVNVLKTEYEEKMDDLVNSFGSILKMTTKSIIHLVNISSDNENLRRIERLMKYLSHITLFLNPKNALKVELAVVISQVYLFLIDSNIANRVMNNDVSAIERKAIAKARLIVFNMFKEIPFICEVAELINYNYNFFDGFDEDISHETLPKQEILTIVKFITEFDNMILSNVDSKTAIATLILKYADYKEYIRSLLGKPIMEKSESKLNLKFDVDDFILYNPKTESLEVTNLKFSELKSGMTLANDLEDLDGIILIPAGQTIADDSILSLMKYKHHKKIKEPISVYK